MRNSSFIPTAFAILLAFSALPASSDPMRRLCKESDLSGVFKLVSLRETPKGEEDEFFKNYPHQYLAFKPAQAYAFMASRHNITNGDELEKDMTQSSYSGVHAFDRRYTLDAQGVLNLVTDGRADYSYRCVVSLKSQSDATGDLILTGYSKKSTSLYKLFHHWP